MGNLRVLLVSPVGFHGGAEQVLLHLARHLPRWGIEPQLACLRPGPLVDLAKRQGLPVHVYPHNYRYRQVLTVCRCTKWLSNLAREQGVHVIHSNFTAHLVGSPTRRLTGLPEIWHLYDFPHQRDGLSRLIERLPCDYIIFATNRVAAGYPQLRKTRSAVVYPSCLEPERLRASPHNPGVRRKYGLTPGPLFLTVARLQAHKGHQYLVEAIPQVLQNHPEAIFGIVGGASGQEQENYLLELKRQCAQAQVQDNVHFLGYVDEMDLVSLYREATALVHPAISEGFGLTLLEAMALGTPVIAAAADGPQELIESESTGILVPTGDSKALAAQMIRVIENPILRRRLGAAGMASVSQYRTEDMVAQTVAVYRALIT